MEGLEAGLGEYQADCTPCTRLSYLGNLGIFVYVTGAGRFLFKWVMELWVYFLGDLVDWVVRGING